MSSVRKPIKVSWDEGSQFRGIVVGSLDELKQRFSEHFHGGDEFHVVLAEDSTVVDDEEYFATLPANTRIIVSNNNKQTLDNVDGPVNSEKVANESSVSDCIKNRFMTVKTSSDAIVLIMTFSNEELEWIVGSDTSIIADLFNFDENVAQVIYDTADNELVRRQELIEASQLLKLYRSAKHHQDLTDGVKKKK